MRGRGGTHEHYETARRRQNPSHLSLLRPEVGAQSLTDRGRAQRRHRGVRWPAPARTQGRACACYRWTSATRSIRWSGQQCCNGFKPSSLVSFRGHSSATRRRRPCLLAIPLFPQCATQQGDRLGPALFTLAIHPSVEALSEVKGLRRQCWYLDDPLVGNKATLRRLLPLISDRFLQLGLSVNAAKCSL